MTIIIFFIIIIFILNISFYYIYEDYIFFIKKIKNSDDIVYIDTKDINDEIKNEGSEIASDISKYAQSHGSEALAEILLANSKKNKINNLQKAFFNKHSSKKIK